MVAERACKSIAQHRFPMGDLQPDGKLTVSWEGVGKAALWSAEAASRDFRKAKWTETASLPESKLVDTSSSLKDRYLVEESAVVHSHGPEGEHSHDVLVATTWLDPTLAVQQAGAIRDAFAGRWPEEADAFAQGFASLESDLLDLDERLRTASERWREQTLVAAGSDYAYLARRYQLSLIPVALEPDEAPEAEAWHELEHRLESIDARWMLLPRMPAESIAERLRALGLEVLLFETGADRPDYGDYLSITQRNADRLESALASR